MSDAHKGNRPSAETRAKMFVAKSGKKRPEISTMLRNRNVSLEHRAKVSVALKGKPKSPEHIAKMSAASKGKKQSPETIARRVATMRRRAEERRQLVSTRDEVMGL